MSTRTTENDVYSFLSMAAPELRKDILGGRVVSALADELAADESSGDLEAEDIATGLWGLVEEALVKAAKDAGEEAAQQGEGADEWPKDGTIDTKAIARSIGIKDLDGLPVRIGRAIDRAFRDAYADERARAA